MFGITLLMSLGISAYSWGKGNPSMAFGPFDSDGRLCGVHPEVIDYPYKFFRFEGDNRRHEAYCVKECPKGPGVTDCMTVKSIPAGCPVSTKKGGYFVSYNYCWINVVDAINDSVNKVTTAAYQAGVP